MGYVDHELLAHQASGVALQRERTTARTVPLRRITSELRERLARIRAYERRLHRLSPIAAAVYRTGTPDPQRLNLWASYTALLSLIRLHGGPAGSWCGELPDFRCAKR